MYNESIILEEQSSINFNPEVRVKAGLDFILNHFASNWFPRTISTKTTQGRQVTVNSKEEALARFKQANYLDCRINAYSNNDIKGDPNFIFIDIDGSTNDASTIRKILKSKFKKIRGHPTVLFTGSGYHIYQPIQCDVCLDDIEEFSNYRQPSKQFLKFAEKYLSNGLSDVGHNPSFKSCMVRVPDSINNKNGEVVKIVQKWDNKRPDIALLIGSFYAWLAIKTKKNRKKNYPRISSREANSTTIQWIEVLLNTPLDDYRKTIVNLVLAPYLINILQLEYPTAFNIIKSWLELCASSSRKLDFDADSLIGNALTIASKTTYRPMRLDTLKKRNPTAYKILQARK